MKIFKKYTIHTLIIIMPIFLFVISICVGRYNITISEVLKSLLTAITGNDYGISIKSYTVITAIRLPRAILGVLVGAALSVSGAAFQSIFRNPLVSSGMLGVSSGAGFGSALAILIFGTTMFSPIFAFFFALVAVFLSYLVGRTAGSSPTITLVLGGTIIQSVFSALVSLTKYVADAESQLPTITFWLMGSLASTKSEDVLLSGIPMIVGVFGVLLFRWRLNVLSMGDREAKALGIDVKKNKGVIVLFATVATAGAICVSGVVSWVGLVVPHIGRMIVGSDNKKLIPASISLGASFMLLVDMICRTLTGSEIPLGIVTALIGSPIFIYLLKQTKGNKW